MKKYDVICAGISTVDLIAATLGPEIFSSDVVSLDSLHMIIGGDAVNQALGAAHLGLKTGLMSLCGTDGFGSFLIQSLEEQGVDVMMPRTAEQPTTVSLVILDRNRERHFAVNRGTIDLFAEEHIDWEAAADTRIVSIGSNLGMKHLDGEMTVRLFTHAREHGALTLADYALSSQDQKIDRDVLREMFRVTDVMVPSYLEASLMTGEKEVERITDALHEMGASDIYLKLGERGCYVDADGFTGYVDALKAEVADTTGAGDNFTAGVIFGLSQGCGAETCAHLGCAAGAIAVEQIGANTALHSREQLLSRAGISL